MQRRTAIIIGVVSAAVVGGLLLLVMIAAVAVPRLVDARQEAYEEAAIRSLHTINTAQVQYFSTYGRYAQSLVELGPPPGGGTPTPQASDLIPNNLAAGLASGYVFTMVSTPSGYAIHADPQSPQTGTLHFYTDASTAIRIHPNGPACETDPGI